jgi:hypothetical protein
LYSPQLGKTISRYNRDPFQGGVNVAPVKFVQTPVGKTR